MNLKRYNQLMDMNSTARLTVKEVRQGWHFCCEFDGLLRNSNEEDFVCDCTPYQNTWSGRIRKGFKLSRQLAWQYLFCSWAHRKHRCYPTVWGPEQAKEMGIPYKPNAWHCTKCHPCGECFDSFELKFKKP